MIQVGVLVVGLGTIVANANLEKAIEWVKLHYAELAVLLNAIKWEKTKQTKNIPPLEFEL